MRTSLGNSKGMTVYLGEIQTMESTLSSESYTQSTSEGFNGIFCIVPSSTQQTLIYSSPLAATADKIQALLLH